MILIPPKGCKKNIKLNLYIYKLYERDVFKYICVVIYYILELPDIVFLSPNALQIK